MKKATAKLKKVAGQVTALAEMIEKEGDCEKIIIQFKAAKGALDGVFSDVLLNDLSRCFRHKKASQLQSIIKQITKQ